MCSSLIPAQAAKGKAPAPPEWEVVRPPLDLNHAAQHSCCRCRRAVVGGTERCRYLSFLRSTPSELAEQEEDVDVLVQQLNQLELERKNSKQKKKKVALLLHPCSMLILLRAPRAGAGRVNSRVGGGERIAPLSSVASNCKIKSARFNPSFHSLRRPVPPFENVVKG